MPTSSQLDRELKEIREEVHKKILPLALKAARKIIGEELKLHPDRIVDIVMTALKPVTQHRKIVLYVNRDRPRAAGKSRNRKSKKFSSASTASPSRNGPISNLAAASSRPKRASSMHSSKINGAH